MTKKKLTELILAHTFDDGTGSERVPFMFRQFDITSRGYHPRYGLLVSGIHRPSGEIFTAIRVDELLRDDEVA